LSTGKDGTEYDVVLGQVPKEHVGNLVVHSLAVKHYCVIDPGFEEGLIEQAAQDAEELDFYQVNAAVALGLLGDAGSARIADMESNTEEQARSEGESLVAVDNTLTKMGYIIEPYVHRLGFDMTHRSVAVVHQVGEPDEDTPPLDEQEVSKWQEQFLRHKIMAIVFIGPKVGTLELQPYDAEDAEVHKIKTTPGTVVLVRADTMSHKYMANGESFAVSSFFMSAVIDKRMQPTGGYHLTPAAKIIEDWSAQRIATLKLIEDPNNPVWDPDIPREWQKVANHTYQKGQMTGIKGISCHYPSCFNPVDWFCVGLHGIDYPHEVPLMRWDHAYAYDPSPECYLYDKTNCKHGTFMDGIELFDNKFFNLSPFESNQLDVHCRQILECGYEGLHNAGMTKKQLMMAPVGTYLGCGCLEGSHRQGDCGLRCKTGQMSMWSGRLAFCLGMKGPAISITQDACSGLTVVFLATESVQKKGKAVGNELAIGMGVNYQLSPGFWPLDAMTPGTRSIQGRCLTFNASADGWVRSDGCGAVILKACHKIGADGQLDARETGFLYGTVAGAFMNTNGQCASLTTPHGPGIQECLTTAIRNACVAPVDVDGVETDGKGKFLDDAIEVSCHWRAHRNDIAVHRSDIMKVEPLSVGATMSQTGNMVEGAGIATVFKALLSNNFGHSLPNCHLRQCNPHIDPFELPLNLRTESLDFGFQSSFNGAFARGWGGSNCFAVIWGQENPEYVSPPAPKGLESKEVLWWPSGGGTLPTNCEPSKKDGYFIVGSWSAWESPEKMVAAGDGLYTFTVTLGENKFERFQIWLDADPTRALHPGDVCMPNGSVVCGPDPDLESGIHFLREGQAPTWLIDGRSYAGPISAAAAYSRENAIALSGEEVSNTEYFDNVDMGEPGDQYLVQLSIAGKWRMVDWEKTGNKSTPDIAEGRYFVSGSWNRWKLEEMKPDRSAPGTFTLDVRLLRGGGEFQIVRDEDWAQVFYPGRDGTVLGPDGIDECEGASWRLLGKGGDNFVIELQRNLETDDRKVTWRNTGNVPLSAAENTLADRPSYDIIGSWDGWTRACEMLDAGDCFKFYVALGSEGQESFQIMADRNNYATLYPSIPNASPFVDHTIMGPSSPQLDVNWTIGLHSRDQGATGQSYEIKLHVDEKGWHRKVSWQRLIGKEKPNESYFAKGQ
jgi:polyketide synthase-associated protein